MILESYRKREPFKWTKCVCVCGMRPIWPSQIVCQIQMRNAMGQRKKKKTKKKRKSFFWLDKIESTKNCNANDYDYDWIIKSISANARMPHMRGTKNVREKYSACVNPMSINYFVIVCEFNGPNNTIMHKHFRQSAMLGRYSLPQLILIISAAAVAICLSIVATHTMPFGHTGVSSFPCCFRPSPGLGSRSAFHIFRLITIYRSTCIGG